MNFGIEEIIELLAIPLIDTLIKNCIRFTDLTPIDIGFYQFSRKTQGRTRVPKIFQERITD